MEITINVETGNASFQEDYEGQMSDIMEQVKKAVLRREGKNLYDFNGNNVGNVYFFGE